MLLFAGKSCNYILALSTLFIYITITHISEKVKYYEEFIIEQPKHFLPHVIFSPQREQLKSSGCDFIFLYLVSNFWTTYNAFHFQTPYMNSCGQNLEVYIFLHNPTLTSPSVPLTTLLTEWHPIFDKLNIQFVLSSLNMYYSELNHL